MTDINPPPSPQDPENSGHTPPPPPPTPGPGPGSPYSAGAPVPPAGPAGARPAELLDRFLAKLIDGVIIGVVNMVVVTFIIAGAIFGATTGANAFGGNSGGFLVGLVTSVLTVAIYLGYFAFMESNQGKTVGKMVMKLHVEGPSGGHPTLEQAIRRNIWAGIGIIGIVPLIGWLISPLASIAAIIGIVVTINGDPVNRQGWHDTFAGGTRVIKEG